MSEVRDKIKQAEKDFLSGKGPQCPKCGGKMTCEEIEIDNITGINKEKWDCTICGAWIRATYKGGI